MHVDRAVKHIPLTVGDIFNELLSRAHAAIGLCQREQQAELCWSEFQRRVTKYDHVRICIDTQRADNDFLHGGLRGGFRHPTGAPQHGPQTGEEFTR